MKNLHRKIELFSNIAIIIVALLIGAVLINRQFFSTAAEPLQIKSEPLKPGIKLSVAEINWSKSDETLLLAISTSCHFCTESIPFYQELSRQKAERGNIRLIAVMPQSTDEARQYLKDHGISVDEVRQANLDSIYVKGTPTLIAVDRNGSVVESWIGKLPPEKETEVIAHFFGKSSGG